MQKFEGYGSQLTSQRGGRKAAVYFGISNLINNTI